MTVTQEFTFETDSLDDFQRMLVTACPLLFTWTKVTDLGFTQKPYRNDPPYSFGGQAYHYPSHTTAFFLEHDARINTALIEGKAPLYWLVGEIRTREQNARQFESYEALAAYAIECLKVVDTAEFDQFTNGNGSFIAAEGIAKIGYRAHWTSKNGHTLTIALCHIYLSK